MYKQGPFTLTSGFGCRTDRQVVLDAGLTDKWFWMQDSYKWFN